MTVCDLCEEFVDEICWLTDEFGEEYELCCNCFNKFIDDYRKGKIVMLIKNKEDNIEIWYDDGTYIFILHTSNCAVIDEITF